MINSYNLRRKFLDSLYFLAIGISYLLVLAIVVGIEIIIFYLAEMFLPTLGSTLLAISLTVLILIVTNTLGNPAIRLAKITFFRTLYDSDVLIQKFSAVTASEMNIKFLEKKIIEILTKEFKAGSADFVLVSDFIARPASTLGQDNQGNKFAPLEKMLHRVKKIAIYEELKDPLDIEIFKTLGISIVVPLKVADEDIGLLVLGPKASKKIYTTRDIKFLERLSPILSVGLKNADTYRKIQEFSQTLESKIIERTHQLEESQAAQLKLKDEFVFIATHDLATPVTAISGFAQLINSRHENLSDQLKKDLMAINEASERLKVLVNDLLQVARSESGTVRIELVDVEAKELIEAAVRQASLVAKDKNINIAIGLGPNNTIKADPKKLSEVVENIVSNGVKYNKPGGSLSITSYPKDEGIVFEFRDTGFGIPESEQAKVFTKFFRSEKAEARQHPGTGLGLFVARMLTEKMGGKITFQSKEDVGTTFYLYFKR